MKRPYFNKSIVELEQTYRANTNNPAVCQALLDELSHRNTKRAQILYSKIDAVNDIEENPDERENIEPWINTSSPHAEENNIVTPTKVKKFTPKHFIDSKPETTNHPQDILCAWTALEVLSPQGYRRETDLVAGDKTRIARFENADLPWEKGEKSRPKKRLYYELILGAISLSPAVEALLKLYSDNRPDMPSVKGYCPIASILLDKEGRPLEEDNSIAISSFAWGVPVALKGDLKSLAEWPRCEKSLKGALKKLLYKYDRDDKILPLTKKHVNDLFSYFVDVLQLGTLEVKPPYFALRRYEFFASKTPPEPGLLNSFYLEDLGAARVLTENNSLPKALRYYLGVEKPKQKTNLLENNSGLQHILQPALTSLGKWPGNGRFPLALLQQAAVNATTPSMMETSILAVNGPPGTGKTTLLRDVVAARIIDRAIAMSGFTKPAEAFLSTQQSVQRSGAKITLHKLDKKLKGFEMIVASSNNKAVENVSAELPSLDAVAEDAPELRYFKSISDNLLGRETWGAIAAVLGNSKNRFIFSQKFWRDDENGLSTYLNHAAGVPQIISEKQDDGTTIKRNRVVIDFEKPPANSREATARWEQARINFLQAVKISKDRQKELQEVHVQLVRLVTIAQEINSLLSKKLSLEGEIQALNEQVDGAQEQLIAAQSNLKIHKQTKDSHFSKRPGFFARLFKVRIFKVWFRTFKKFETEVRNAEKKQLSRKRTFDSILVEVTEKKNLAEQVLGKVDSLESEKRDLKLKTGQTRTKLDVPIPDAQFFANDHEYIQVSNVWYEKSASKFRDDVFEAAILLHRAFIDAAADPLRQNLSIFIESFGTRSLGTSQKDALIADLWASFFLVVPVVSTTFASVHRMFSRLAPESLGWLLVDEAGQAVPQAAVGAMMRTKRSVVVGDPLQIEPVVTLPNSLTEEICAFFGIDREKYNAPDASVQTVADAASMYCARFPIGSGHRDVGAPLLVHRRCDSPMFDISNEIAYSNLMVQAKNPSPANTILGPSAWIDVQGTSGPDKWCANEATVLIDMLERLKSGGAKPDLYIVTPFVIVQDNLRQKILQSRVLEGWVDKPNSWVYEHIGTVHTVQGREAEIVFFVLGAQKPSQSGARGWAGGRPNLVNVAVTRAKSSLYVIGNRNLWKSAGVFATLDRYLPVGFVSEN